MIFLFYVRSEVKNPKYKYKYGFVLESYCRSLGPHFKNLVKQNEVIESLTSLSDTIKKNKDNLQLIKGTYLQDELESNRQRKCLSNFISPINRSSLIGSIK